MNKLLLFLFLSFGLSAFGQSNSKDIAGPNCDGPDGWAAAMSFTHMKNAGLIDNKNIDFSKTTTARIASQRLKKDLWHQVYRVSFTKTSGEIVEAIAVHDASNEECSMSGVEVFVISKRLGEAPISSKSK